MSNIKFNIQDLNAPSLLINPSLVSLATKNKLILNNIEVGLDSSCITKMRDALHKDVSILGV